MKRDITTTDLILMIAGIILTIIHFGLIAPYAYELMMREMGL